jgi:hypothetical protein
MMAQAQQSIPPAQQMAQKHYKAALLQRALYQQAPY